MNSCFSGRDQVISRGTSNNDDAVHIITQSNRVASSVQTGRRHSLSATSTRRASAVAAQQFKLATAHYVQTQCANVQSAVNGTLFVCSMRSRLPFNRVIASLASTLVFGPSAGRAYHMRDMVL